MIRSETSFSRLLVVLAVVAFAAPTALAGPNFLAPQTPGVRDYPATARLLVDTPTTLSLLSGSFVTDGLPDYEFNVTGTIRIQSSGAIDNFTDPITSTPYGAPADGLNTLKQEIVQLTGVNIVGSAGAAASSLVLGDGTANFADDGPMPGAPRSFFSTGGASENPANGSTASGFLNLFLEVNITNPTIVVPPAVQALGYAPSYSVGLLHNEIPLHLEAMISEYPPYNIPFLMPGGTVSLYSRVNHPLVQDLNTISRRALAPLEMARFTFADLRIVPEPSSLALALMSGIGIMAIRRRQKRTFT